MDVKVVSYSEVSSARRCSFRHELGYVERWSKPPATMGALSKGTAWHAVMEARYNAFLLCQRENVISLAEKAERARVAVAGVVAELDDELGELIWWMYKGYAEHWGTDEEWEIIAVEHPAEVMLPLPSGRPSRFRLKMKIDLVVRDRLTGRIRIIDHKSGKDLPGKKALEADDQFPLYQWGLTQLGRKVFGMTYNAARTTRLQGEIKAPGSTPLDQRFQRLAVPHSDKALQIIATSAYLTARSRYQEQQAIERMGVDAPRTTDPLRCQWDCDFYNACMAGRKGLDSRAFLHGEGFRQNFERH